MQVDEAGTLAALKARQQRILQPLVSKYRGRIVKVMGDGVLVQFASVINALSTGVSVERLEGGCRLYVVDRFVRKDCLP